MPINRQPALYQGYVISMIGTSAGQEVEMDFKNAQNCVAVGTHRWADDPTDIPAHVQLRVDEREAARLKQIEADALHFQKLKEGEQQQTPADIEALAARAREIHVVQIAPIEGSDATLTYISRPLPPVIAIDNATLEAMKPTVDLADTDAIVMTFQNAKARYKIISNDGNTSVAELVESDQPDVDIPEDWRELHHLTTIPMAKAIRRTDGSMTKADAEAIIEEWVTTDDPVHEDDDGEEGGEGEQQGTEAAAFKDRDGNPVSAEERSRQAAQDFDDGIDFKD